MLHIIQVVMWGVAEMPHLFLDEEKARSAYVECAKKRWEQRYSAYCEHNGVSRDAFLSAQAFVKTIDVSEKSALNFWSFNPQQVGLEPTSAAGADPEKVRGLVKKMAFVQENLTRLVEEVAGVAGALAGMEGASDSGEAVVERESTVSAPAEKVRKPEPDPGKYSTQEWKNFVATIKRLGSGSRNDFSLLPRDDWRNDVYSNRTSLEYWEWVAENVEHCKEEAMEGGYSVIEDPDTHGSYRFSNAEGISGESYYSDWEAWCAAGLHAAAACHAAAG